MRENFGKHLKSLLGLYEGRKNTAKERRVLYGITQEHIYNQVKKKHEVLQEQLTAAADHLHEMHTRQTLLNDQKMKKLSIRAPSHPG